MRRCEGCLRFGARPPPAAQPQSGLSGSYTHVLWPRACRHGGPVPLAGMPCGELRAAGVVGVCSGGDGSPPFRGASGVRRCPSPGCPSLGAGSQDLLPVCPGWCWYGGPSTGPGRPSSGQAVGVCYPLAVGTAVRAWGPSTVPLACMPCGGLRAAGWGWGDPWRVAFHRCEGSLEAGAVPLPAARPWGRVARTRCPCVPGTGCVGMGDPAPAPQGALLRAGVAPCGVGGSVSPGGGALRRCQGRLSSSALPSTGARPQGGLLGSAAQVLWARVCARVGPALSLWLACPAGGCVPRRWEAVPWGAALHCCEGCLGQALSLPWPPVPWGERPVVREPCLPGVVGVGVATQHRPHSLRSCEPSLRAVEVAGGLPRGGGAPL